MVSRWLCVHIACAVDAGLQRTKGIDWLVQEGLYDHLTQEERGFLARRRLRRNQREMHIEAVFALMWIASLADDMDFRKRCPDDLVYSLPNLHVGESSAEWRRKAKLRDTEELLLATDLAYFLHWAFVEATFKGRGLHKVDMQSVRDRRQALEWLFVDEDWDDVPLDT